MHTCIHVFISPTLVSQICSTDNFYGIFTINYVKIKTSVFLGIVFFLLYVFFKVLCYIQFFKNTKYV